MSELATRLAEVDERIAAAARSAGRDSAGITRVVVTKFQPVELVRELVSLGVRDLGESRHQEAVVKAAGLADAASPTDAALTDAAPTDAEPTDAGERLRWHFVGQLQTKKARQVRRYASALHSLDRDALIDALAEPDADADGVRSPLDAFLQLDLTGDPGRGGADHDDLLRLAERAEAAPGIRLLGLMAVAPREGDPAAAFARVRAAAERMRAVAPGATALSMGMSGDFEAAIREGATHLRIGTAITGNRPVPR